MWRFCMQVEIIEVMHESQVKYFRITLAPLQHVLIFFTSIVRLKTTTSDRTRRLNTSLA